MNGIGCALQQLLAGGNPGCMIIALSGQFSRQGIWIFEMSYAGDATCLETWESLKDNKGARLVDVRTTREWETIGVPDLSSIGKDAIFVEWQKFPDMGLNPEFTAQVNEALSAEGITKDDPIYFLCRSGARSQGAASAMTAFGYKNSYNILSGFEGSPNATGQRGTVNGWQFDQLPMKKT